MVEGEDFTHWQAFFLDRLFALTAQMKRSKHPELNMKVVLEHRHPTCLPVVTRVTYSLSIFLEVFLCT